MRPRGGFGRIGPIERSLGGPAIDASSHRKRADSDAGGHGVVHRERAHRPVDDACVAHFRFGVEAVGARHQIGELRAFVSEDTAPPRHHIARVARRVDARTLIGVHGHGRFGGLHGGGAPDEAIAALCALRALCRRWYSA